MRGKLDYGMMWSSRLLAMGTGAAMSMLGLLSEHRDSQWLWTPRWERLMGQGADVV